MLHTHSPRYNTTILGFVRIPLESKNSTFLTIQILMDLNTKNVCSSSLVDQNSKTAQCVGIKLILWEYRVC